MYFRMIEQGFSDLTDARQLENYSFLEKITNSIGYRIESIYILEELFDYQNILETTIEDNILDVPVPFWFRVDQKTKSIWVLSGFITDYASIPRFLWPILSPREIRRPAIFHDALYRSAWYLRKNGFITKEQFHHYRKIFDELFFESMAYTSPYVGDFRRLAAYKSVRWFGGFHWIASEIEVDPDRKNKYNKHTNKPK